MIEFEWPALFFLMPLPIMVYFLLPAKNTAQSAALTVPSLNIFQQLAQNESGREATSKILLFLSSLAWILLIIAACRPTWVGDTVEIPISGRDLILAVDLSESMEVEDFVIADHAVNRLVATKRVASEFIHRRISDRIGLILFGEKAYVQTPLTFDRQTVLTLLNEAFIGLAGKRTAIGDAIGLAIKRFQHSQPKPSPDTQAHENNSIEHFEQNRVLILLTDGANTAGEIQPVQAAELAAKLGLKIYTIGIGADEMLVRSFFGARRINPSADLDEKALKAIADKTGGRYFRAHNTEELVEIYRILDELELHSHAG